jgi:hypothetical protein
LRSPSCSYSSAISGRRGGCEASPFEPSPLWTMQNSNHGVDQANTPNVQKSTASDQLSQLPSGPPGPPSCSRRRSITTLLELLPSTTMTTTRSGPLPVPSGSRNVRVGSRASARRLRIDHLLHTRLHRPQASFLEHPWLLASRIQYPSMSEASAFNFNFIDFDPHTRNPRQSDDRPLNLSYGHGWHSDKV